MPQAVKPQRRRGAAAPSSIEAPLRLGRALIDPQTVDREARTIEAEFTTGERGLRDDIVPGELVYEELDVSPGALVLDLLRAGAPVTNGHTRSWRMELDVVLGVVEDAWFPGGGGLPRVRMRFSDRDEEVDGYWRDIAAGIIRQVSPGYLIHELRDVTPAGSRYRVLRATRWEPYEIAFTPVAFDRGARTRSRTSGGRNGSVDLDGALARARALATTRTVARIHWSESTMDPEEIETEGQAQGATPTTGAAAAAARGQNQPGSSATPASPPANQPSAPPAEPAAARAAQPQPAAAAPAAPAATATAPDVAGIRAERARVLGIQELGRSWQLPDDTVANLIAQGTSLDAARAAAVEHVVARQATQPVRAQTTVVAAEEEKLWRAIDAAFDVRCGVRSRTAEGALGARVRPSEDSRAFVGRRLVEVAERCLQARGVRTAQMGVEDILEAALSRTYQGVDLVGGASRSLNVGVRSGGGIATSDFSALLANVANKSMRQGYDESRRTFEPLVTPRVARDFKPMTRVQLANAPSLLLVPEGAEITRGSLPDSAETYAIGTYSRILPFTRQAMVNDDLEALSDVNRRFGNASSRLESDLAWGLVTGNVVLGDGVTLFHATHKNVGTGAITIGTAATGLDLWLSTMRNQTGLAGEFINLDMGYLVVPPSLEVVARQMLEALVPDSPTHTNPLRSSIMGVISEARLQAASAVQWYGTANPSQVSVFERAYLNGQEGPQLSMREGWEVLGMEFRAIHEVALAVTEFVAWYRSTGS